MNSAIDKNFGLTEAEFSHLRLKLLAGDEELFELTFLRHFSFCYDYVVREDKAREHVAYDAVMEAFVSFRRKIKLGKIEYGNLRFLLTRMARQHYAKRITKELSSAAEPVFELSTNAEAELTPPGLEHLRAAWLTLGDECRRLLHAFYYRDENLKQIAARTQLDYAVVRKRKQRCVDQLRERMKKE